MFSELKVTFLLRLPVPKGSYPESNFLVLFHYHMQGSLNHTDFQGIKSDPGAVYRNPSPAECEGFFLFVFTLFA